MKKIIKLSREVRRCMVEPYTRMDLESISAEIPEAFEGVDVDVSKEIPVSPSRVNSHQITEGLRVVESMIPKMLNKEYQEILGTFSYMVTDIDHMLACLDSVKDDNMYDLDYLDNILIMSRNQPMTILDDSVDLSVVETPSRYLLLGEPSDLLIAGRVVEINAMLDYVRERFEDPTVGKHSSGLILKRFLDTDELSFESVKSIIDRGQEFKKAMEDMVELITAQLGKLESITTKENISDEELSTLYDSWEELNSDLLLQSKDKTSIAILELVCRLCYKEVE